MVCHGARCTVAPRFATGFAAMLTLLAPLSLPESVEEHEASSSLVPRSELPLRTRDRAIISAGGRRVQLHCTNWYGSHLEQMVPNGLNNQPLARIATRIVELGFNCVRLPFSTQLAIDESGVGTKVRNADIALAANPELQRWSPFQIFNLTVRALTKAGLLVILNNHISTSRWCCGDDDDEGLWYTPKYPEKEFMESLSVMASCFKDDPLVIGIDIRNELRTTALGAPTWGDGNPETDWSIAVVKSAEYIHAEAPDMLIIVSGLSYGIFLCQVPQRPIHVSEPQLRGHVVYTAHDYPWFSFHVMARQVLEQYLVALSLVAFCVVSCILVSWLSPCAFLSAWLLAKMPHCRLHRLIRCHGKCCWWHLLCRKASATVVLTLFAVIGIALGDSMQFGCGQIQYWILKVTLLLATLSAAASFVLWMHIATICLVAFSRQDASDDLDEEEELQLTPQRSSDSVKAEVLGQQMQHPEALPTSASKMRAPPPPPLQRASTKAQKVASRFASQPQFWRCLAISEVITTLGMLFYAWHSYGQYDAFERELDQKWGFLLKPDSDAMMQAPVWLGEFGTDVQNLWWQHLMRYLKHRKVDWAYWALNGQKTLDTEERYGLLQEDMMTVRHSWKLADLQALMK